LKNFMRSLRGGQFFLDSGSLPPTKDWYKAHKSLWLMFILDIVFS
jgi:hypothetical protein